MMTGLEEQLSTALYRTFCPPSEELGEYTLNLLDKPRTAWIKRHLQDCPHCTREVEGLREYLEKLAPDLETNRLDQLVEQVKVWIAQLVPTGSSSRMSPAFGLRGEMGATYAYQAGEAQLTLEAQDDADQVGRRSILGLLIGVDPQGYQALLWQNGQYLASVAVDELGNFILPHLKPATYELILSGPIAEIHVEGLEIT